MKLPKKIKIYVTRKDISRGQRADSYRCPIALALKRRLGVSSVTVYRHIVDVGNLTFHLPEKAGKFITYFDSRLKVSPIRFTLE